MKPAEKFLKYNLVFSIIIQLWLIIVFVNDLTNSKINNSSCHIIDIENETTGIFPYNDFYGKKIDFPQLKEGNKINNVKILDKFKSNNNSYDMNSITTNCHYINIVQIYYIYTNILINEDYDSHNNDIEIQNPINESGLVIKNSIQNNDLCLKTSFIYYFLIINFQNYLVYKLI